MAAVAAAAASAGTQRGGEDRRPGPVHEQVDERRRTAHRPAQGAERLRERDHPEQMRRVESWRAGPGPGRGRRGPRRAPGARRDGRRPRRDPRAAPRRRPSRTRNRSRRSSARADDARQDLVDMADVGMPRHGHGRPAQPAPVDDRRVVQLVADDEAVRPTQRSQHAEVGGVAGREHQGRSVPFQLASAASRSSCTGRDPTTRRLAVAPVPHRSMAVCAAPTHVRVRGQIRGSRSTRTRRPLASPMVPTGPRASNVRFSRQRPAARMASHCARVHSSKPMGVMLASGRVGSDSVTRRDRPRPPSRS